MPVYTVLELRQTDMIRPLSIPLFFTIFISFFLSVVPVEAGNDRGFIQKRRSQRKERQRVQKEAKKQLSTIAKKAESAIRDLLPHAKKSKSKGATESLMRAIKGMINISDYVQGKTIRSLVQKVRKLDQSSKSGSREPSDQWKERYNKKFAPILKQLKQVIQKLVKHGIYSRIKQFVKIVFSFDPDNQYFRQKLGFQKYNGEWLNRFRYKMAKKGLIWHRKFGWIIRKNKKKYSKRRYYDLQRRKWTSLTEANKYHGKISNMWKLRTEHLQFKSTAPLKMLTRTAGLLESFYNGVFVAFTPIFLELQGVQNPIKLVFGKLGRQRPHRIVYLKNKKQYLKQATSTRWSGGMYIPRRNKSYFYGKPQYKMFHEFTHQLLRETIRSNQAPSWLTEGVAVYAQHPMNLFNNKPLKFGQFLKDKHLKTFLKLLQKGKHYPVKKLLKITNNASWKNISKKTEGANYSTAGALTWFCMEIENRKYRRDFLDYVRDSYYGRASNPFWEYMGMTRSQFFDRLNKWKNNLKEKGKAYFQ